MLKDYEFSCRNSVLSDMVDISELQNAYYQKFHPELKPENEGLKWVVCIDPEDKVRGCYAYRLDTENLCLFVGHFYVNHPFAIRTLTEDIQRLGKQNGMTTLAFATAYANERWNKALQKNGYVPSTLIYSKEL